MIMGGFILIPLAAAGICVCLHLVALRVFPALRLMDFPERYGLQRAPLPYPTGILASLTFLAFYAWLRRVYRAHAIVHIGKHGNLEWLPGKAAALSAACGPDARPGPREPHRLPMREGSVASPL